MIDPDEWWHSLPLERRQQIMRWMNPECNTPQQNPGQRELFPHLAQETPSNENPDRLPGRHADRVGRRRHPRRNRR